MKTLDLSIVIFTMIVSLIFGLGQAHADNVNGIYVQNITVQPSGIKVGTTFTITSTLVNNSTISVLLYGGKCSATDTQASFSIIAFDNHVKTKGKEIFCAGVGSVQILNPGKNITETSPDYTADYIATEPGTVNATVMFSYSVINQTDPTQSGPSQNIQKSFLFTILDNNTENKMPTEIVLSPLKQFKSGTAPKNIICTDNLVLTTKRENGSPACINSDDFANLVIRGWAVNPLSYLFNNEYSTQKQQDKFFYDIMNLAPMRQWSETGWRLIGGNNIERGDDIHFSQLQFYLPPNSGDPKVSCDKGWHTDVVIDTKKLVVINATYPMKSDCKSQAAYISREMELQPKGPNESVPNVIPNDTNVIPVQNSNFTVKYNISSGNLEHIEFNKTRNSLVILLISSDDGDLTMTIPRVLLDSKQHIQPYQFTVLVDDYPIRYTQTTSDYYNTLTIPFSHGSGKIEITVPE